MKKDNPYYNLVAFVNMHHISPTEEMNHLRSIIDKIIEWESAKKRPRIIVHILDGCVSSVISNNDNYDLIVVDEDDNADNPISVSRPDVELYGSPEDWFHPDNEDPNYKEAPEYKGSAWDQMLELGFI